VTGREDRRSPKDHLMLEKKLNLEGKVTRNRLAKSGIVDHVIGGRTVRSSGACVVERKMHGRYPGGAKRRIKSVGQHVSSKRHSKKNRKKENGVSSGSVIDRRTDVTHHNLDCKKPYATQLYVRVKKNAPVLTQGLRERRRRRRGLGDLTYRRRIPIEKRNRKQKKGCHEVRARDEVQRPKGKGPEIRR